MDSKSLELEAIIEIPRGCSNKYEHEKDRNIIKLDRVLYPAMYYPTDYGYFPNTLAKDGDPLDALILVSNPLIPGCYVDVRPIGCLDMEDDQGIDEKVLCVATKDPIYNDYQSLSDVSKHLLVQIEEFFKTYKNIEKKETIIRGWKDTEFAINIIKEYQL